MNSILLNNALKIVPNNALLVNVVRLRVRQLLNGARPLVLVAPGLGLADTALTEIADGKLTSEATIPVVIDDASAAAAIIAFPGVKGSRRAA